MYGSCRKDRTPPSKRLRWAVAGLAILASNNACWATFVQVRRNQVVSLQVIIDTLQK
jgi:hypothetical protein